MVCSGCGGPVARESLGGKEWFKCMRCGAWVAPTDELNQMGRDTIKEMLGDATTSEQQKEASRIHVQAKVRSIHSRHVITHSFLGGTAGSGGLLGGGLRGTLIPEVDGAQAFLNSPLSVAQVPPPPRYPSALAKKLIFSYQGKQHIMLWMGIIIIIVGGIAISPLFRTLPAEIALIISSKPTIGIIIESDEDPVVASYRRDMTNVVFEYVVNGKTYRQTIEIAHPQVLDALSQDHDQIPVEYSEIYPGFAKIQGLPLSPRGWSRFVFLLVPLIGVAILFEVWRSNRREIHAYKNGLPTLGRIVERIVDTSMRSRGRSPMVIRWVFTVNNIEYRGELSNMDWDILNATLPGPWVVVLYDPVNPRNNTVYIP